MAALNTAWELSEAELKEKTVAELRDICELQNIRGVSRLRKQELVDRIIAEMSSNSNNNNNKSHSAKKSNANSNDASGRGTGAAAAAGERKEGGSGAGASDDKVCSLEHGKRFKGASMLTADEFETKVKELIRDTNISKYHKDCAAIFGAGDYYRTRSRTQAAKAAAIAAATASSSSFSSSSSSASSLEMEHTFECQLAGHAVMQTTSLHNILRNLDVTSPRTQQPAAVKRVLDAVFAVQNERQEFFNIKLLDKTLNVQKGAAAKTFLEELKKQGKVSSTLYYKRLSQLLRNDVEGERVAGAVMQELGTVHGSYVDRIQRVARDGVDSESKSDLRHASGTLSQNLSNAEQREFVQQMDDLAQNLDDIFSAMLNK